MQWREVGIVVGIRKYGDSHVVLSVLTRNRGLCRGLARLSKKSLLQPGDCIDATWRAKLASNLGFFTYEVISSAFYQYFCDPVKLMCLSSITSIIDKTMPENASHPKLYDAFVDFTHAAETKSHWHNEYLKLELAVLSQLGFALDLSRCAVSNSKVDLAFISPKTGRALSKTAGFKYKDKLLPLPKILHNLCCNTKVDHCSVEEFIVSFKILGFFLCKYLLLDDPKFLESRKTLITLLS